MLPSLLLALREGLEAALIIGIVSGVLLRIQRRDLVPAVWWGAGSAAVVSLLVALALNFIGAEFEGRGEQLFEGIAMLSAAVILTWMILWMKRQAGSKRSGLENDVKQAAARGGSRAVFLAAFLAAGREGLELALFLTATGVNGQARAEVLGAVLGLGGAAVLGYMLFRATRKLNLKMFFQLTNVLLLLFAAGLMARGIHEFNEAGIIPGVVDQVWNVNPVLNEESAAGEVLTAMFGYDGNPSLTEVAGYLAFFGVLGAVFARQRVDRRVSLIMV